MSNAWDHLPNAKYIDLVLASLKANPDEWHTAWLDAHDATWNVKRDVASRALRNELWVEFWDALWDATKRLEASDTPINAAWTVILALVTCNDCAHMLDSELDDLRILSKLGSHPATLMIPAAIAFRLIREKELTC